MLVVANLLFIVVVINFASFVFLMCFFSIDGYEDWMKD
jgi:hypothetical protein